jgi:hypothetical protein
MQSEKYQNDKTSIKNYLRNKAVFICHFRDSSYTTMISYVCRNKIRRIGHVFIVTHFSTKTNPMGERGFGSAAIRGAA